MSSKQTRPDDNRELLKSNQNEYYHNFDNSDIKGWKPSQNLMIHSDESDNDKEFAKSVRKSHTKRSTSAEKIHRTPSYHVRDTTSRLESPTHDPNHRMGYELTDEIRILREDVIKLKQEKRVLLITNQNLQEQLTKCEERMNKMESKEIHLQKKCSIYRNKIEEMVSSFVLFPFM